MIFTKSFFFFKKSYFFKIFVSPFEKLNSVKKNHCVKKLIL